MFKIVLVFALVMQTAIAAEVKVQYNNFRSSINSTTDEVVYKDATTDLSLKKKKCNSHIIERLVKELSDQSRNLALEKVQDHPMTVTIDGSKQTIDQRTPKGQFFHHYIEVMKQAKIEEMLSCK